MARIDTTVGQLEAGDTVHLDGQSRTVTSITPSDVAGYVNVGITPGFDSGPLHQGSHWSVTKIA